MRRIRWGLIGCGDIAEKRVVAALKSAKDSELVACTRRVATSLKDFQERHQIPKGYAHVSDLLRDPEIDAVYLATPVALHHQHALEAAMQGKHVLCGKPMALDSEKCRQMIQVCRQQGGQVGGLLLPSVLSSLQQNSGAFERQTSGRDCTGSNDPGGAHADGSYLIRSLAV